MKISTAAVSCLSGNCNWGTSLLCFCAAVALLLNNHRITANSTTPADVNPAETDYRCKCICPRVHGSSRAIYILNVTPDLCNCDHVVLPRLQESGGLASDAGEFCATCQCKHESRNSWTIKVVVILFIVITSLLLVYMCYLLLEARFCNKSVRYPGEGDDSSNVSYEQHFDDEEPAREDHEPQPRHRKTLRSRLSDEMSRWKQAVMRQRGNVYIRRTVLNN